MGWVERGLEGCAEVIEVVVVVVVVVREAVVPAAMGGASAASCVTVAEGRGCCVALSLVERRGASMVAMMGRKKDRKGETHKSSKVLEFTQRIMPDAWELRHGGSRFPAAWK